jgi:hypothetical protein
MDVDIPIFRRSSMRRIIPALGIPVLASLSLLGGCGAGSSDSSLSDTSNTTSQISSVAQGQFLDSAVSGLWYETATQSGFTNEFGQFSYIPGESVTFYLGTTWLGEANAQDEVTPLDLMTADDHPDKLQNLLRVLQTLDADADPSNGIDLNSTTQDYLTQYTLPLNSPAVLFEASNVVQDMIAATTNGGSLKDAVDSFVHFRETLLTTRRNIDQTPILNLLNTTWDATITSTACPSNTTTTLVYGFTILGITTLGYHALEPSDEPDTCTRSNNGFLFSTYETDPLFTCANQCLDSDLNRVIMSEDDNGDVVTTLNFDQERQQISIRTTRFNGVENVTTTQLLTRR